MKKKKQPETNMLTQKKKVTSEAAADYLNISVSTLGRWASERRNLPFLKIGKRREYYVDDLECYIEKSIIHPIVED